MPTRTFANLPAHKREAFLEAAIEEFSGRDFESASVSRIVANLGIAKGSVYQYFTDKADLYLYLIEHAEQLLLAALTDENTTAVEADFFDTLRHLMSQTVIAARRYPRESVLLERAYRSSGPWSDRLAERGARVRVEYLAAMVRRAQDRGELDPLADPSLVTLIVDSVVSQIGPWLDARLAGDGPRRYDDARVEAAFDQAITLLRCGIAGPGAAPVKPGRRTPPAPGRDR